ncbi:alpha-tocopherol transfer protein-like [Photinus pyralis]|nr:alpha-tocopherol transfer protein-like [Photinus pyralis]
MKPFDPQDEYSKNSELRAEDVRALQEWTEKQPHMPPIPENILIVFLRGCHWGLEQTKATIEKFLTCRSAWPDFFANLNPRVPNLKSAIGQNLVTFLPMESKKGYKLLYYKLMVADSARFNPPEVVKLTDMVIALETLAKGTYDGLVLVYDVNGCDAAHILKVRLMDSKRFLGYAQDALPVRLKAIHIVLPGKFSELVVPIVKPFMKREFLRNLHFHDSYESLFKRIPQESFPKEIGGKQPTLKELHENMEKSLVDNADLFLNVEGLVANEALRDRSNLSGDSDLEVGVQGSFRKIGIE